jgi:hypothetical protein
VKAAFSVFVTLWTPRRLETLRENRRKNERTHFGRGLLKHTFPVVERRNRPRKNLLFAGNRVSDKLLAAKNPRDPREGRIP